MGRVVSAETIGACTVLRKSCTAREKIPSRCNQDAVVPASRVMQVEEVVAVASEFRLGMVVVRPAIHSCQDMSFGR
jgi:hypothetical protein